MKKQVSIDFIVEDPGLYRIAWKDFRTGRSGCSAYSCSWEQAEASVRELNSQYPDSIHWVEANPRLN